MNAVDVRNLTVRLGDRELVADVSFSLPAGQVLALVGASGSGKTTTGLALLGEHPAGAVVTGDLRVAGNPVAVGHPPPAGAVGHVPQHPSAALNPVRRVGSVLRELARQHVGTRAAARGRALDAARRARFPERLLRRFPHQLSGGQQQRVVLAHALVSRPHVVVADEPTTGQDVITRQEIAEELRHVRDQGVAVLLLTHDLELVRAVADRVAVLHGGALVEQGSTDQVLDAPRHEHTRRLVESRPLPRTALSTSDSAVVAVRDLTAGHRRVDVVRDVSWEIPAGGVAVVVGRSGSGKTTLARCIAGLHPLRTGEVLLGGDPLPPGLRRRSRRQLARIQYVFQDARASFGEFNPVVDQVARTAQRLRGLDRAAARDEALAALARLGVPERVAARPPGSLSGGELRRAALVRAVLAHPEVLICDEITSGLDTVSRAALLRVLDDVRRDTGCALVVITHDLAVAADLGGDVLIVDEGRVVERGSAEEVLTAPRHPASRALVTAARGGVEIHPAS
ncbi:ABC transporter ATP-binding protein [Saccharopolyspora rosea]|uniref:ABC transporter ATP-binding protein n=1 Tax=Saccharopolyspora rosea TaxID=524884 RepID=A0ABW3G1R1_9PSEU|nr:ATP-binding cassette domain-containing protein [Saccharopolyspora rosea]